MNVDTGAESADDSSLLGFRVLIPRGGELGARLAAAVAARGGDPVIAPVIEFSAPNDAAALSGACSRVSAGAYDWLVVTSATTVDYLAREQMRIPASVQVAAIGDATEAAMSAAGFPVTFVPRGEHSAAGMIAEWSHTDGRVLIPQSEIAEPTLAVGLGRLGMTVETVTAYRTIPVTMDPSIVELASAGMIDGILVTSSSIAREVARQCSPLASTTVVACIGSSTATAARSAGLDVQVTAAASSAASLVAAFASYGASPTPDNSTTR